MIYLIQILKMLTGEQQELFIKLFNDLSYEIEDLGYSHPEDLGELINETLELHFGVSFADDKQLRYFTEYILKKQGELEQTVNTLKMMYRVA